MVPPKSMPDHGSTTGTRARRGALARTARNVDISFVEELLRDELMICVVTGTEDEVAS
jgi:hypothetical protein